MAARPPRPPPHRRTHRRASRRSAHRRTGAAPPRQRRLPHQRPPPAEAPTAAAAEAPTAAAAAGGAGQFAGVEINILTFVGPQVAEPLQRRGPDFTKLTGAKVNVVTVPNSELYQKALADLATGTNSYDGFLFAPSWIVDFAPAGYLEDLTDRVKADTALEWDDVAPFFRDFNSYQGKVYSIPLDGDFHMVYYRSDILAQEKLDAAQDLGRLPEYRQNPQRQGSQWRWHTGLRLVHCQSQSPTVLLVDHVDRRALHSKPGHGAGRLLQYEGYAAAVRQ